MEVCVNVGLVKLVENGQLKPMRGKSIPMKVMKCSKREELMTKAIKKHQAHNNIGYGPFDLLYPNLTRVKNLLEKEEELVLEKYKLEAGKPYNRLNFFLVSVTDFIKSQCSHNSDSDDEIETDFTSLYGERALPIHSCHQRMKLGKTLIYQVLHVKVLHYSRTYPSVLSWNFLPKNRIQASICKLLSVITLNVPPLQGLRRKSPRISSLLDSRMPAFTSAANTQAMMKWLSLLMIWYHPQQLL